MYETLYDMVKGTSVDYIKADFDTFKTEKDGKRKFELVKLGGNEDGMIYNRVIDPRRVCNLYVYDYYIWKGIYRRSFLIDNGIRLNESKGAAYQDIGFSHQIHTYATKAYYSDMSFYRYRLDRDGSSSNSLYGLSYGHQEYKWLLENREFQSRIVCPKGIYMHMASSFRGEMNKTLPAVGFDTESEYIKPHYDWIKARLINDAGRYLDGYRALIADLGEMLDDLEGYCGRIKGEYLKKKAMEDMIHSADKGGGVVIFGAGKRGRRMLSFLLDKGVNNVIFADNDSSLWGSYVDGVRVFDPAECVEMYADGCFIIANSANTEEIVEQLVSMGVDRGHILDCYGEIFGLKLE
jgi:hypothetical protein